MHLYQIRYDYLCWYTTHILHKKRSCEMDETAKRDRLYKRYRRALKKRIAVWKQLSNCQLESE